MDKIVMNEAVNKEKKISDVVIPRILNYLKVVQQLEKENKTTILSEELSRITNTSAVLIRKDLANFGKIGQPGTGYDVSRLKSYLLDIIGGKEMSNLAVVGVGNLGSALLNYKGFEEEGLKFVAAFDKQEGKIGRICGNVIVEHIDNMGESIKNNNVHIGIITVPSNVAQAVAEKLVGAGVYSILNFSHVALLAPPEVTVRNVDLAIELKALRYFSVNR
ncbi:MAG: redox-sensing transcriptional repressor Rex [Candidatus Omnitrophica bacterium]|nr:redox-sensing transcriptional repressor Rex [Candidatus Omnitrophota bacterium]